MLRKPAQIEYGPCCVHSVTPGTGTDSLVPFFCYVFNFVTMVHSHVAVRKNSEPSCGPFPGFPSGDVLQSRRVLSHPGLQFKHRLFSFLP